MAIKEKKLPELQKEIQECVFCGISSGETGGSYYKEKFYCIKCSTAILEAESFLK
jgi:recombinational DNA repair protein (RecF pathway)